MDFTTFEPFENELPSAYADRLGLLYSDTVDVDHKKGLGQYFTPAEVAHFMAGFCHPNKGAIKILDPGAGLAILSCAVIEYLIKNYPDIRDIELMAFETDEKIISYSDLSLEYLGSWVRNKAVNIRYFLCKNDFISHNSGILNNDETAEEVYDIIICNPPYFKIPSKDPIAVAAKRIISGQSNIYSIFMIVAAKLLGEGGQLIFITPRSFCSGEYFKLFRQIFFSIVNINYIHLFNSRKETFERDSVLQENIIVSARRQSVVVEQLAFPIFENIVQISSSTGTHDIEDRDVRNYKLNEIIDFESDQKILHIPATDIDNDAINIFKNWNGTFEKYGIKVSTGPVVDFRNKECISSERKKEHVPLLYLHNVDKMKLTWPLKKITKNKEKGQYIKNSKNTKWLVPNSDYVLLRRFSSKDDTSKLIAAPCLAEWFRPYEKIGLENHLNYIYRQNGRLHSNEVYGIAALLNSKLFDVYFRTFNGNINVSATELRDLPLPTLEEIVEIGRAIKKIDEPTQEQVDRIVEQKLITDKEQSWKSL